MMDHYEALGCITEQGGLEIHDRAHMLQSLRDFPRGASVLVSVSVHRETRSRAQNRYWHGVVIPAFAEHCGYTSAEAKDALALELLPHEVIDIKTGEVRIVPGHTSQQNVKQFNDLIDRAQRLGAELGLYVPDPGEDVTGPPRRQKEAV